MTKFVLVSQTNWEEKGVDRRGRPVTYLKYKPPQTMEQAQDWPGTEIIEAEKPPKRWGHGTYAEDAEGKLRLVNSDWDSSG